jgi:hypothetical protein
LNHSHEPPQGSDTAFAFRAGVELSQQLESGFLVALSAAYQRTAATKYHTNLPDERFRIRGNDSVFLPTSAGALRRLRGYQIPPIAAKRS